ncbi:MAG TPA: hypothetical protein VMS76_15835, partial [Planctomycetota bacterium]|nr:hypothetical protein [Planctomycetota bacterium]
PGTLSPALFVPQAGVLREYRMQYISFNDLAQDPPPPTPWIAKLPPVTPPEIELNNSFSQWPSWVLPQGSTQGFDFYLTGVLDPEVAQGIVGPNVYFNTQADLLWTSGLNWWTNVQVEYR